MGSAVLKVQNVRCNRKGVRNERLAVLEQKVAAKGAGDSPEAKQLSHQEFQHGCGSGVELGKNCRASLKSLLLLFPISPWFSSEQTLNFYPSFFA
jgi:hypothetical protein